MNIRKRGFTLIELLVVISIIAVLMSIMMPALARVREQAKQTSCMSNMKSLAQATMVYSSDYKGRYPLAGSRNSAGQMYGAYPYAPYWDVRLLSYLGTSGVDISIDAGKTGDGGDGGSIALREDWKKHEGAIKIFNCPSSRMLDKEGTQRIESRSMYVRSYRMNAYLGGMVVRLNDGYYLQDKSYRNSLSVDNVKDTARVVMFGESQRVGGFNNLWGHQLRGWPDVNPAHFVKFGGATTRVNPWGLPSSSGKSGFVFADCHVENLNCQFTDYYQNVSFIDYADPIKGIRFHPTANW